MHPSPSPGFRALLLLAALAASPAGGRDEGRAPRPEPPPDPTFAKDYEDFAWREVTAAAVDGGEPIEGRIAWPVEGEDGEEPPAGPLPLVLLLHGEGHAHIDYGYLLGHLASNGFVAAAIQNGGTNAERAERALAFLDFVVGSWEHREHVADKVALVGHSRGGEAVLTLARLIHEEGLGYDVRTVVSLAPTDDGDLGEAERESLDGASSPTFLVMYGSHDEDVHAYCLKGDAPGCDEELFEVRGTGFSLYDRAGTEAGTETPPETGRQPVTKSLLFIRGADHNSWREVPCDEPPGGRLDCPTHRNLLCGYLNAWLRYAVRGEALYRGFFTGGYALESAPAVVVQHQFQEASGRRVVDDFESEEAGRNALGGAVSAVGARVKRRGATFDYDPTIPHDTRALVVAWSAEEPAPARIGWELPDERAPAGGRLRDVSGFGFLSLRAGQVHGSALNAPGRDKDLFVQLVGEDGAGSRRVRLGRFGRLAYPDETSVVVYKSFVVTAATSPMTTVRVPLAAFEGVDLAQVSAVRLILSVPGSEAGELVLDNLEFTD